MRVAIGAVIVLVLVALCCAVVFAMLAPHGESRTVGDGRGEPEAPTAAAPQVPGSTGEPTGGADTPAATATPGIFVHVLGAVHDSGLYELAADSRVVDAVGAAGGMTRKADETRVNLARFLVDGEQLYVPEVGEDDVPASGGASGGASGADGGATGGTGAASPAAPVNINTADAATLETLPRVGPAMAARIIEWREANGGFATVDDLLAVTGIGEKTLEALRALVTV